MRENHYFSPMIKSTPLIRDFLDLLFPRTCCGCHRPLVGNEQFFCLHCATQLPYHNDAFTLQQKLAGRLPNVQIFALLQFTPGGLVKKLLHEIKYKGNTDLAIELGRKMGLKLIKDPNFCEIDVLIPVPLHPSRQRARGYNQSEKIAVGISEITGIPCDTKVLSRVQKSVTQTRKNRDDRWKNVKDIFAVKDPTVLSNKTVLLIDDVITTGATLEACGQTLLKAGVGGIKVAAMASA